MFKRKEGFTLVELMIVIAIIALLMLVIMPRMGALRKRTQEIGIANNANMVAGLVRSYINEYPATAQGVIDLELKIFNELNSTTYADNERITNPITGAIGCDDGTGVGGVDPAAVIYATDDNTEAAVETVATFLTDPLALASGMIGYGGYLKDGKIKVKIVGYDTSEAQISTITETLSQ